MISDLELIKACRVPEDFECGVAGLWRTERYVVPKDINGLQVLCIYGSFDALEGFPSLVMLKRTTWKEIMTREPEVVMEDSPREIRTHFPILKKAFGNVLVSGLGLGCVVRGLLAREEVNHVDVVEISEDVLDLCSDEFEGNPRVTIRKGDALKIRWPKSKTWDFAWHDIWADEEAGQPHLQVLHAKLLRRYDGMVRKKQGAWKLRESVEREGRKLNASIL